MKKVFIIFTGVVIIGAVWFSSRSNTPNQTNSIGNVEKQEAVQTGIPITATFTLPILALHHIGPAPSSLSANAKTWYISEERFDQILRIIQDWNLEPITARELLSALQLGYLPERAIMLTFDDGAVDFYTYAFPLLQKYNMSATMHLQSHVRSDAWLSEDQIRELAASGLVEFGSHTKYHQYLTRVSEAEAREELEESKERIEEVIGNNYTVSSLAYPFGLYNEDVKQWADDAGYKMAFTIDSGATQYKDDPLELTRIIITEQTNIERLFATYYELIE